MVRLMQKERLKSPHKPLIIENQAFWVILAILAKIAILVILATHFRDRMDLPKEVPFGVRLKSARRGHTRRWYQIHHCAEIKFECWGCVAQKPARLFWELVFMPALSKKGNSRHVRNPPGLPRGQFSAPLAH